MTKNGWPAGREAGVVDPGDVGMVHHREGLPLGSKRGKTARESMPVLISLSATLRLTGSVWLGDLDRAHAAFADFFLERVTARDDGADPFARRDPGYAGREGLRCPAVMASGSDWAGP